MTFVREIPKQRLTEEWRQELVERGFKLVDKEDSTEVWVESSEVSA